MVERFVCPRNLRSYVVGRGTPMSTTSREQFNLARIELPGPLTGTRPGEGALALALSPGAARRRTWDHPPVGPIPRCTIGISCSACRVAAKDSWVCSVCLWTVIQVGDNLFLDTEYLAFFESLGGVLVCASPGESVVQLGDFNVHIGKDSVTWKGVNGRNSLPDLNLNCVLLMDFCANHHLSIGCMWHQDTLVCCWGSGPV